MKQYAIITKYKTDQAMLELEARLKMDKTIGPNCKLMVVSLHDTRGEAEYEYKEMGDITEKYFVKILLHDMKSLLYQESDGTTT